MKKPFSLKWISRLCRKKQLSIPIRSDMHTEITVEPQIKHQLYIHNKIGLISLLHRIIITNSEYLQLIKSDDSDNTM